MMSGPTLYENAGEIRKASSGEVLSEKVSENWSIAAWIWLCVAIQPIITHQTYLTQLRFGVNQGATVGALLDAVHLDISPPHCLH